MPEGPTREVSRRKYNRIDTAQRQMCKDPAYDKYFEQNNWRHLKLRKYLNGTRPRTSHILLLKTNIASAKTTHERQYYAELLSYAECY